MGAPQADNQLTLAIAERSAAMRRALVAALGGQSDIELVGVAEDRERLLSLMRSHRPDVLVLDPGVLGPGGLRTLPLVREAHPGTAILVSDFPEWPGYEQAVRGLGASGFILKSSPPDVWLRSIREGIDA